VKYSWLNAGTQTVSVTPIFSFLFGTASENEGAELERLKGEESLSYDESLQ
jgi:hypothetical protein